jgi:hypothetical protein
MYSLTDGDIIVYRAGFAAEGTLYTIMDEEIGIPIAGPFDSAAEYKQYLKDEGIDPAEQCVVIERERTHEPLSHALANVKSIMANIHDQIGTGPVFLSQGKCFRTKIATMLEYKGNRKDAPKPVWYNEIREYLVKHYGALIYNAIEADDALAIAQTSDSVIVSIDKDLLQVPGMHYNWVRDEKLLVTPEVGLRKLYQQVLTGDGTDNIPGIYGIGDVNARKLIGPLADEEEMIEFTLDAWDRYLDSDKKKFIDIAWDGVGEWEYTSWDGDLCSGSSGAIRDEILNLVRVGDHNAKEAAHSCGEEVPIR